MLLRLVEDQGHFRAGIHALACPLFVLDGDRVGFEE